LTTTIKPAIAQYRQNRSIEQIVRGILFAILSTIALIVLWVLLQRFFDRLLTKIRVARRADGLDLRVQNFQLLGSDATGYLLASLIKVLRLGLILGGLYLYIPFVLSQFPATKAIGRSIFSDIAFRINQIVTAFVQYLPNLIVIVLIAVLTYYVIQFAKLVITELGRDDAYPWFYPEWIQPTTRLANLLLIAIACIIAAPYLPGFNSPAFQGVSLFLGALFTLGSSSAIANAIAGVILIYTRAFQIGDIIQISETIGEVLEKTLFVTRVLTFKKEVITIPNASVLNSNVVNFNAISREFNSYLLLHTTITLGYDVPWRKVHEVLIQAAKATPGITDKPLPFVLQTGLNDFHVSYELNAYSAYPQLMPKIYSELHQHIQDYC
ncbi:MAG TPA: mechanosensitive ion channel domain-containing protein, partial [Allocoleopsis sp.]